MSLLKSLSGLARHSKVRRKVPSRLLFLECLESRTLLSVCTVDRLTDNRPAGGGEGGNGMGDLRWCIVESLFQADTINFSVTGTINLAAALPDLTRNVSIESTGLGTIIVTRATGGSYPIFTVSTGVTANISDLIITNGSGRGSISNSGTLTISNSIISETVGATGIYNLGTLTVTYSTISGNSRSGIFIDSGRIAMISNSTISRNSGYGIENGGMATVSNSTISGNAGGINIYRDGRLTVNNSTIAGNSTPSYGGGIYIDVFGSMSVRNTIIAGNSAPSGPDVYGNLGSQGHNLVGNPQDAMGFVPSDLLHVNPRLGPLQGNGGPTMTHALLEGSPAIDAGDNANVPQWDQRGPGYLRIVNGTIDIGAFEVQDERGGPATHFNLTPSSSSIVAGSPFTITITARDSGERVATTYRGTVHFTSTDNAATLPDNYTFTDMDNGTHIFPATLRTAGNRTISVTDTVTGSITGSATILVNPAAASGLLVAGFPSPVVAGDVQLFTVTAQDPFNNTATGYRGTIHFTSTDRLALFSHDYTFTVADNGNHTFGAVFRTAGTQTITATDALDGTILGTQKGIEVVPAQADHFRVDAPITVSPGLPFDLTITALDPYGNTATQYSGTVVFSSSDMDPEVVLPPDYTFTTADGGVASFPGGVTLITDGDQTLSATDTKDDSITGLATVTVTGGNAPREGFWVGILEQTQAEREAKAFVRFGI